MNKVKTQSWAICVHLHSNQVNLPLSGFQISYGTRVLAQIPGASYGRSSSADGQWTSLYII